MCKYKMNKEVPVGILEKFSSNTRNTTPEVIPDIRILRHTTVYDELDDYNIQLINDLIKEEA